MFTRQCIIKKKYDLDFLDKLKNLGYNIADYSGNELDCIYIISLPDYKMIDFVWSEIAYGYFVNHRVVDCFENEELFLAIAALRDDTNNNQWFIDPCGYWHFNPTLLDGLRKATVSELIKHFKK